MGALNFRLIEPLEGPSVWKQFIADRGEGLASIAVMFKTLEDSDAVKREWYYLDTQPGFKCNIESGSGHAVDFMKPVSVYPSPTGD